jgi:hypothetical protein
MSQMSGDHPGSEAGSGISSSPSKASLEKQTQKNKLREFSFGSEWPEFTQLQSWHAEITNKMDQDLKMCPEWEGMKKIFASLKKRVMTKCKDEANLKEKLIEAGKEKENLEQQIMHTNGILRELSFHKWGDVVTLEDSIAGIEHDIKFYTIEDVAPLKMLPRPHADTPIPPVCRLLSIKFARLEEFNWLLRRRLGMQKLYKHQETIEAKFGGTEGLMEAYTILKKENYELRHRERRFAVMPLLKRRHDMASYPPAFLCSLILGLQNELAIHSMALEEIHTMDTGPASKVAAVLKTYALVNPLWPEEGANPPRYIAHACTVIHVCINV